MLVELKSSYVIFLCDFDFFGYGDAVYSFSMKSEERCLPLGDESYTIILNSRADESVTPEPLRELFRYMNEAVVAEGNELIHHIDDSVETWNTGEGVNVILTLAHEMSIKEERARKEGFAKGLAEGREAGLAEGLEVGIEQGIEQGVIQGRREEQLRVAKGMKDRNIALDVIASCTGLAEEEIERL